MAMRRQWRAIGVGCLALLAIIGPGLIVMVGPNDAGGVSTYAQAGQNYGTSLLWVLLLLIPVLIVNQEMVVRLGAVTGVGHARLINERFGRGWGWFSGFGEHSYPHTTALVVHGLQVARDNDVALPPAMLDNGVADAADYPAGYYTLLHEGQGTIAFDLNSATVIVQSDGLMLVNGPPGETFSTA